MAQYTADLTSWIDLYVLLHYILGLCDLPQVSLVLYSSRFNLV
jgi:hypothetical protein